MERTEGGYYYKLVFTPALSRPLSPPLLAYCKSLSSFTTLGEKYYVFGVFKSLPPQPPILLRISPILAFHSHPFSPPQSPPWKSISTPRSNLKPEIKMAYIFTKSPSPSEIPPKASPYLQVGKAPVLS